MILTLSLAIGKNNLTEYLNQEDTACGYKTGFLFKVISNDDEIIEVVVGRKEALGSRGEFQILKLM